MPFDPQKPMVTSGIRLGSPAATSRGFGAAEFAEVGRMIVETLDGLAANGEEGNGAVEAKVRAHFADLTRRFPIYRSGRPEGDGLRCDALIAVASTRR